MLLEFQLCRTTCVVAAVSIREVVYLVPPVPITAQPSVLRGAVAYRGGTALVLDGARLLGQTPTADPLYEPALVWQDAAATWALGVDRILGTVPADGLNVASLDPHHSFAALASEVVCRGDERLPLLDLGQLLMHEEQMAVQEFASRAAERLASL